MPVIAQEMSVSNDQKISKPLREKTAHWFAVGGGVWLVIVGVLMAMLVWGSSVSCSFLITLYLAATLFCSLACFTAYGLDKRRSKTEAWRISEAKLHWLAFFGGWPGGLLGQRTFRHKTQKVKFQLIFWSIVILHLPLVFYSLISIRFGS